MIKILADATAVLVFVATSTLAGVGERPENGKAIYRNGIAPLSPEISVRLAGSAGQLAGRNFACANCHGSLGQGKSEAGITVPQIDWGALTRPRFTSAVARGRSTYDSALVQRAIADGVDADGSQLNAGMPRYQMNALQMAELIEYLRILGTSEDNDPGVGDDFVKIGTLLPLTGPKAKIGLQVAAALNEFFDRVNAQGGVYRRRIQLSVMDLGTGDAASRDAGNRVVTSGSFALVASFVPPDLGSFQTGIAEAEVPLIGPLGIVPRESDRRNTLMWYLVPSFADQARVLVDYISAGGKDTASKTPVRVSLIHATTPDCEDAASGARSQLALHRVKIAADVSYEPGAFEAAGVARLAMTESPEWVLFFGPEADLESLAAAQAHLPTVGTLALLTPLVRPLPTDRIIASPFEKIVEGRSVFEMTAVAAARTLIEAMSRRGRKLDRAGLHEELEQLHEFDAGVLPAISFSPNNHIGVSAAAIVRFDPSQSRYHLLAPWQKPAEIPR